MKANKLFLFVLLLSGACPAVVSSQVTQVEVAARYHPASKYLPPSDSMPKDGKAGQSELNLSTQVNIYTRVDSSSGKVRSLGSNIQGRYTTFSRTGYNNQILPSKLYCFNVGLYYYSSISPKWAYTAFVNTALNSDMEQIDKNDLFVTGGAVFIRRFSPDFSLGLGAIVHNNLGGFMPWPALTVDWKIGNKFKLDIRTPDKSPGIAHYVGVSFIPDELWSLSFAFQPEVLSYDVTPGNDIKNRLMNFWQLPFTLSAALRMGDFEIIPRIGFTALRSYAYGEKNVREMFTKYPYHSLGANLNFGIGIKYQPFNR